MRLFAPIAALAASLALAGCLTVQETVHAENGMIAQSTTFETLAPIEDETEATDPCSASAMLDLKEIAPFQLQGVDPVPGRHACRIDLAAYPTMELDGSNNQMFSFTHEASPDGYPVLRARYSAKEVLDEFSQAVIEQQRPTESPCAMDDKACIQGLMQICSLMSKGNIPEGFTPEEAEANCIAEIFLSEAIPQYTEEQIAQGSAVWQEMMKSIAYSLVLSGPDVLQVSPGFVRTAEERWEWRGTLWELKETAPGYALRLRPEGS